MYSQVVSKADIAKRGVRHIHAIIKKSIIENVNGTSVF